MPYFPPLNFGAVEDGLYRSAIPTEINFQFLQTLSLKTVIILTSDAIDEQFSSVMEDFGINALYIENTNAHIAKWSSVAEETVIEALKILLDRSNYPVLVTCKYGKSLTGTVIGCMRKLQRWSMVSIFEEYRRFTGCKVQQQHEQFIELFDTDLVTVDSIAPLFLQLSVSPSPSPSLSLSPNNIPENLNTTLEHILGQLQIITHTLDIFQQRLTLTEDRVASLSLSLSLLPPNPSHHPLSLTLIHNILLPSLSLPLSLTLSLTLRK